MGVISPPTLRAAAEGDCVAIAALKRRNGLGTEVSSFDEAELRIRYRHRFVENPALQGRREPIQTGWVLQAGDGVVGYLGSIPLLYRRGSETYLAAAATTWVVDPPYRSSSTLLVAEFCRQRHVDLLLDATADYSAGRVFSAFKFQRVPNNDYGTVWFWVTNASGFLASGLRKFGFPKSLGYWVARPIGPLLAGANWIRGSGMKRNGRHGGVYVVALGDVGQDFDDLWERKCGENRYLLLARDAQSVRWHFAHHAAWDVEVFGCRRDGRLAGYLVMTSANNDSIGLKRSRITDILAEDDDCGVVGALVARAYSAASERGSHIVEMLGFPPSVRGPLAHHRPQTRKFQSWPFYYRIVNQDLARELRPEEWYICAFDGDASL
jgi:hypothetical protein